MWSRCGYGELLMSRSFIVCVLFVSKPANLTTLGDAQNMPLEPTVSYAFFLAIGLLLSVLFLASRRLYNSIWV